MTWFRMDDTWGTHPKVQACSPLARLLWVYGGLYCAQHLTDGAIPSTAMPVLLASAGAARKHHVELVDAGLWDATDAGWMVRNWHEYQPSRDDVEAVKKKRRTASVEANHKRWHIDKGVKSKTCPLCNPTTDPKSDPSADASGTPPVLIPSSSDVTNGCTNNSSSADCPPDDDDPAVIQGRDDYRRAVERGADITDHAAYLETCIANRRAILAQPMLPADAPRLPRPHDDCPHDCDHGWLYPNGPDGGVTPCTGTQEIA